MPDRLNHSFPMHHFSTPRFTDFCNGTLMLSKPAFIIFLKILLVWEKLENAKLLNVLIKYTCNITILQIAAELFEVV